MTIGIKERALLSLGTTALVGSFATSALAFTLNSTAGTWSNVQGGSSIQSVTVGDEAQIRWGSGVTSAGQSGLGFTGVDDFDVAANELFEVGSLRHFNNAISGGTAAAGVDLSLSLDFAALGLKTFDFTLAIDETPNSGTCVYPSVMPCADKIAWTNSLASQSFEFDGANYTLELLGFRTDMMGSLVSNFISQEGGTSEAVLLAQLTIVEDPDTTAVPEPGLLLGLGAIGATLLARHRRNLTA